MIPTQFLVERSPTNLMSPIARPTRGTSNTSASSSSSTTIDSTPFLWITPVYSDMPLLYRSDHSILLTNKQAQKAFRYYELRCKLAVARHLDKKMIDTLRASGVSSNDIHELSSEAKIYEQIDNINKYQALVSTPTKPKCYDLTNAVVRDLYTFIRNM